MEGHFTMDERRWREKVRRFEFEAKDLRAERDKMREELNMFLSRPTALAPDEDPMIVAMSEERDALKAENKELKDKIKGLNMQLGRYKNKG